LDRDSRTKDFGVGLYGAQLGMWYGTTQFSEGDTFFFLFGGMIVRGACMRSIGEEECARQEIETDEHDDRFRGPEAWNSLKRE
jgi:hypothetical protein